MKTYGKCTILILNKYKEFKSTDLKDLEHYGALEHYANLVHEGELKWLTPAEPALPPILPTS